MGGGSWTAKAFADYSTVTCSRVVAADGTLDSSYTAQDLFTSSRMQPELNPYNVVRECCDSEEHPKTVPVILALDVTGSMGSGAAEVAKRLNTIMTNLYESVKDVEFLIMGIGDLDYDISPVQASQFESDVRIAVQLDKMWFEGHGGGNAFESYTVAWYFGLRHTKLDCWSRGKKGIIITMGDEPLNPYLPKRKLETHLGDSVQADINTNELYKEVTEKFDVYHLAVDDRSTSYGYYAKSIEDSFGKYLDGDHLKVVTLDTLAPTISNIITESVNGAVNNNVTTEIEEISW